MIRKDLNDKKGFDILDMIREGEIILVNTGTLAMLNALDFQHNIRIPENYRREEDAHELAILAYLLTKKYLEDA